MGRWTTSSLKPVIEAIIFASGASVSLSNLRQTISDAPLELIRQALRELQDDYCRRDRGIELVQAGKGYRFQTRPAFRKWIITSSRKSCQRLSRAALETLAVIAYKQPVTRAEIEKVRGVDSSGTIRYLLSKNLVRIAGRKDVPGRPLLYGTTSHFLEVFQLRSIKDLPGIDELESGLSARQAPLFDKKAAS